MWFKKWKKLTHPVLGHFVSDRLHLKGRTLPHAVPGGYEDDVVEAGGQTADLEPRGGGGHVDLPFLGDRFVRLGR